MVQHRSTLVFSFVFYIPLVTEELCTLHAGQMQKKGGGGETKALSQPAAFERKVSYKDVSRVLEKQNCAR